MISLKSFIKGFILLLLFPIAWILSFGFYLYFTPTLLGIVYFFLYSTFFLLFVVLKVPFFKLFKLSKPKDINEWLIFWNVMFCFFPIQIRCMKHRFCTASRRPGGFREFQQACRNHCHLF